MDSTIEYNLCDESSSFNIQSSKLSQNDSFEESFVVEDSLNERKSQEDLDSTTNFIDESYESDSSSVWKHGVTPSRPAPNSSSKTNESINSNKTSSSKNGFNNSQSILESSNLDVSDFEPNENLNDSKEIVNHDAGSNCESILDSSKIVASDFESNDEHNESNSNNGSSRKKSVNIESNKSYREPVVENSDSEDDVSLRIRAQRAGREPVVENSDSEDDKSLRIRAQRAGREPVVENSDSEDDVSLRIRAQRAGREPVVENSDSEDDKSLKIRAQRTGRESAVENSDSEDDKSLKIRAQRTGREPGVENSDSEDFESNDEHNESNSNNGSSRKKSVNVESNKSYREPVVENSDSEDDKSLMIKRTGRRVKTAIISDSEDEDVVHVATKNEVIDISSEDDSKNTNSITQKLNQTTFKQTTLDDIIKKQTATPKTQQIKVEKDYLDSFKTHIAGALKKVTSPPGTNPDAVYCTQQEYTAQATKVADIRTQLKRMKLLIATIKNKNSLPDGGASLKVRETNLEQELLKEDKILSKMIVEHSNIGQPKGAATVNWEQIQAGSSAVVPNTWGKKAMETHNIQKALTMDRLQALHGSLETCPGENDYAEDPKYLKVELMPHQKRALVWLLWREKQKPSGGILADDMGLGKTLTMISLVMKSKEIAKENGDEESESDKENDNEDDDEKEDRRKSKLLPQGGTLVICPASLLQQWDGEVERRTKRGLLSVELYHGNNRENNAKRLAKQDMVVTTYNLAMRECEKKGPLFRIRWRRIILDEAHVVRNHKSQTSIAMCSLKSKSRWTLTGTPVHNKELDLYALLKFLRCSPFDDLAVWKRWVDNKNAGGQDRLNMVMQTLMLRRTKAQLQENCSSFKLPEKKYELIQVTLDKHETQVYQKVLVFSRTLFAQFLHQRTEKNVDLAYTRAAERPAFMQKVNDPQNEYYKLHKKMLKMHGTKEVKSHEILVLLLRLRQICCHPSLITSMLDSGVCESEGIEEDGLDVDLMDKLNKLDLEDDDHQAEVEPNGESEDLNTAASKVLNTNNPIFKEERRNEKISKVIETLKNRVIPANDKAVVVSQWTSMLRLVRIHCVEEGINCDMLDGSVPVAKRNDLVRNFNDPKNPMKVLLLSLTAGGVGLNLVGGNHLFLLDLHWNPQLESQAQDRIYRVGQTKPVYIYKMLTLDTIEERIKALQESKLQMATDVLSGTKVQPGSKLSLDDLRMLFSV